MEKRLQAELQFHLERQISDYVRVGMTEEARRKARLQFGGLEQVKEECREARGILWVESILHDVRFALRMLRQSPGFTVTVIGTLALGIGANAAIFRLLDAVRLRSLPVVRPQELAMVQVEGGNSNFGVIDDVADLTYPLWEQIRQYQQGFSGVFAWAQSDFFAGSQFHLRHTPGLEVSGELFPTLGVAPLKGRLFARDDDRPGCGLPGVVISYGLWQSEFGGKDSAIGSTLRIFDHPLKVIGVTPPRFSVLEIGRTFDIAIPFCSLPVLFPEDTSLTRRDDFWINVMGRDSTSAIGGYL